MILQMYRVYPKYYDDGSPALPLSNSACFAFAASFAIAAVLLILSRLTEFLSVFILIPFTIELCHSCNDFNLFCSPKYVTNIVKICFII